MLTRGYSYFVTRPYLGKKFTCKVCGTECDVERGIVGATSYAEAMANKKHKHDRFSCPNSEEDWHKKALRLIREIEETESDRVAHLIRQDLHELLSKHGKSTKLKFNLKSKN